MPERISQKQRIALAKERCAAERLVFAEQAEALMPNAKKTAVFGFAGWGIGKLVPLLGPIILRKTRCRTKQAKIGGAGWIKIAGILSTGVALSRLTGRCHSEGKDRDVQKATIEKASSSGK